MTRGRSRAGIGRGVLLLALAGAAGCGENIGVDGPILSISADWENEANPAQTFRFDSFDDGKPDGHFTGFEILNGTDSTALNGSWTRGVVLFTVARATPKQYRAQFLAPNPTRLVFTSGNETLTLRQP